MDLRISEYIREHGGKSLLTKKLYIKEQVKIRDSRRCFMTTRF
jgi:hypothetical protein